MKAVLRLDISSIKGIEKTPQGFLKIPIYASRVGIQIYRDNLGNVVREFRSPEEVFAEDAIDSLRVAPLTNEHPSEMVNVDNAKKLVVGYPSGVVENVDNKFTKTHIIVFDKDTIKDIEDGRREISLGYSAKLHLVGGEYNGEKYDAFQTNIKINHIALVDRARGGPELRLRTDSAFQIINDSEKEGEKMKIKIGDKEFSVEDDLGTAIKTISDELDACKKSLEENKNAKDSFEVEKKTAVDAIQAKADALTSELAGVKVELEKSKNDVAQKLDSEKIAKEVKIRVAVEKAAEKFLDKDVLAKIDSMSNIELKKAIIVKNCPEAKLEDKSETYIEVRYDHIIETADKSSKANDDIAKSIIDGRKDGQTEVLTSDLKREESMKKDSEAWKKPIGKTNN